LVHVWTLFLASSMAFFFGLFSCGDDLEQPH
jgi:hypothetical protein